MPFFTETFFTNFSTERSQQNRFHSDGERSKYCGRNMWCDAGQCYELRERLAQRQRDCVLCDQCWLRYEQFAIEKRLRSSMTYSKSWAKYMETCQSLLRNPCLRLPKQSIWTKGAELSISTWKYASFYPGTLSQNRCFLWSHSDGVPRVGQQGSELASEIC